MKELTIALSHISKRFYSPLLTDIPLKIGHHSAIAALRLQGGVLHGE